MLHKVLRMVLSIALRATYISYDSDVERDEHKALTHHGEAGLQHWSTSFSPFH